jgi:hypothetical protein
MSGEILTSYPVTPAGYFTGATCIENHTYENEEFQSNRNDFHNVTFTLDGI